MQDGTTSFPINVYLLPDEYMKVANKSKKERYDQINIYLLGISECYQEKKNLIAQVFSVLGIWPDTCTELILLQVLPLSHQDSAHRME